jgi:hypothetical protein
VRGGGGLANRGGRRGAGDAADRLGRVNRGPDVNGGVRGREKRARQHDGGVLTRGPGQHSVGRRSLNSD